MSCPSLRRSGMARVNEGSQFYLPPTRLCTSGMSHARQKLFRSRRASPHLGWYSFPVPPRVGGLLGGILRWFARPKTVTHPSTSRGGRKSNARSSSHQRNGNDTNLCNQDGFKNNSPRNLSDYVTIMQCHPLMKRRAKDPTGGRTGRRL